MLKIKLVAIMAVVVKLAVAVPTLALTNLSYAPGVAANLINNTDVRGALIASGKFKVIEAPKGFNWDSPTTQLAQLSAESNGANQLGAIESVGQLSAESSVKPAAPQLLQDGIDYVLVGHVLAAEVDNNLYQIANTDKNSLTRNLSVTVSYKLVRLKDRAALAAFNAYGSASQVKLINVAADPQSVNFDQAKLIRDVAKDLANDVINQLSNQYINSIRQEQQQQPVITDVKHYD